MLKELNDLGAMLGELPSVFEEEDPDFDEFELALTDLSEKNLSSVYSIFEGIVTQMQTRNLELEGITQ